MAQIYRIDELRARQIAKAQRGHCYCDVRSSANQLLGYELAELRRTVSKPRVLCLQNLDWGIPVSGEGWDFICSSGLLSGQPAVAARQVVKTAVTRLKPGGRMVMANVLAGANIDRCGRCRSAAINHRTEAEMASLAEDVSPEVVSGQTVFHDPSGLNVFLELHKTCRNKCDRFASWRPLQRRA